ncbi:tyrosine-type recombinase/integrase [Clostridium pasteurianum]|uniref:tyrosine-type recombinase/integrase n=1 Tax=Clostridium pasteurianum TaxID=1501 RepID=UPI0002A76F51|nr:tyrosine-type recombinase/integrase [Clostridium pasteurianum]ELP61247.1 hypothetical protein F502_02290 [Clostridium pasteurianum DSM 525 = ATCC 6013]UZW16257.1 tyrosine-type recombinase/integrase [Clostridium pasteurianum]
MRNYALIVLGLNTVLRISDILLLTWNDVYDFEEKTFKTHVYIKEKKTGKDKKFLLNKNATEGLLKHKRKLGHIIGHCSSHHRIAKYFTPPVKRKISCNYCGFLACS